MFENAGKTGTSHVPAGNTHPCKLKYDSSQTESETALIYFGYAFLRLWGLRVSFTNFERQSGPEIH